MPNILFVDSLCPAPYDPDILANRGLGGTEATVVRIAEGLAKDLGRAAGKIIVLQRGRQRVSTHHAIYGPLEGRWVNQPWDAVVVLRSPSLLDQVKKLCPASQLIWWLHDLADDRLGHPAIAETNPVIVTVSDFHRWNIFEGIQQRTPNYTPQLLRIYNPIDDDLNADDSPLDRNKLVFFSSPHKGLSWTLRVFAEVLPVNPAFRLHVANPGYFASAVPPEHPGSLHDLGSLPHKEIIRHARESLCVFYLNYCFPETFGLILAEANAVGTPVLTHPMGAAPEILQDHRQLVDVRDVNQVIERLMCWHESGRPVVSANEQFRLATVVREWKKLLRLA